MNNLTKHAQASLNRAEAVLRIATINDEFFSKVSADEGCEYDSATNTTYATIEMYKPDLVLVGKVFGQDGWVRKTNYDKTFFNWRKMVDGVILDCRNVEEIPRVDIRPIVPRDWPIALEDSK